MFRGHNNIIYGRLHNILYKNGLYKDVCNVTRFRGHQNNENMSKGMTYRTQLSPSTAIFGFISVYTKIISDKIIMFDTCCRWLSYLFLA